MKKIILAAALAAIASVAVVGFASADVPRYQPTATLVVSLTDAQPGNQHTYTITWTNPCGTDGAFTGTGQGNPISGGASETISGTYANGQLTFTATYLTFIPGYTWSYNGPLSGGVITDSLGGSYTGAASLTTINSFKNHGDYVSSQGGGSDAAHSCIGMPIH